MPEGLRAIDCDVHPMVPAMSALAPYLDEFWRDQVRGARHHLARRPELADQGRRRRSAPTGATRRAAAPRPSRRSAAQALEPFGADLAILNPLYGVQMVLNADMAVAFTRALNDWTRAEWLDRDDRLRASIVLPLQDIGAAVAEIERLAPDRRFVQALVLAMGDAPLGKRQFWPVYEALRPPRPAARHPRRQRLQAPADLGRLDLLVPGGIRRQPAGLPKPARLPRHRRHASASSPTSRWSCSNPA